MDAKQVKTATELLQRPRSIASVVLQQHMPEDLPPATMPELSHEEAGEFLVAMTDGLAEANANFAALRAAQQANATTTRSVDAIEVLSKAYELASDHWGEFMFLITYLDRKGSFNKLKKKKGWRDFFGVLLEEE